jgi:hypothetical protein
MANIKQKITLIFISLLSTTLLLAQNTGTIKGRVYDQISNQAIEFATVSLQNTTIAVSTDAEGKFEMNEIAAGLYNVQVTFVGYKTKVGFEVRVNSARPAILDFPLEQNAEALEAVEIVANPFTRRDESPLSLRSVGVDEIKRNPGGNRDISRVVQALPGVASTPTFRNDILIRGGAPSENRFYLDGIEIPTINHFSTQGASGGPVGMVNVDFVREVDFYAGAFPVNRGNALSSVFDFQFKEGNLDKARFSAILGATDFGVTADGPLGKKANFIFSARRSYLQFLFKALELPFLPVYNDAQFKVKINIDEKNSLTLLGIGALDDFSLNSDANETEEQRVILERLPISDQWNYSIGAKYTHFRENSYMNVILSRSHLNNRFYKYANNDESSEENLVVNYNSNEVENKARLENVWRYKGYKIMGGINYEWANYDNNTFYKRVAGSSTVLDEYETELSLHKYGAFVQASKAFFDEKLSLSGGLRIDGNSFDDNMRNPLSQLSPRFSASYSISPRVNLNFNSGIYYQLPTYTALGFAENGILVNQQNNLKYIQCSHLVGGVDYQTSNNAKISIETFYKSYANYPFSLRDSVSLANLGADFGVIGDEPVASIGKGDTYGLEVLIQQKLYKGFYGILAYTLSWSQFEDRNGDLLPSSWDNRHIINLTLGQRLPRNWEIGTRYRYVSGSPYTPYDLQQSALIAIWDIKPGGVPNYAQLNSQRIDDYMELDLRVDKKWFFKRWNLNLYLDIDNLLRTDIVLRPNLALVRDDAGVAQIDPNDATRYQIKELENLSGTRIPSIGAIVEF